MDALQMAIAWRKPLVGLLHHANRGSQYACADYRALLDQRGITCSRSRKGDCGDNAVAERFFARLKKEMVDDSD